MGRACGTVAQAIRKSSAAATLAVLTAVVAVVGAACGSSPPATGGADRDQAALGNGHTLSAAALGVSLHLPAGWISASYGGEYLIGRPIEGTPDEVDNGSSHMTLEPIPATQQDAVAGLRQGAPHQNLTINGHSVVRVDGPQTANYDILGQGKAVFILAVSPVGATATSTLGAIVDSLRWRG